ncbi:MAG: hypothetical protein Q9175_004326 [Cornicularia normoerica]
MAPLWLGCARRCCGSGLCGGVQNRSFYVPMALIALLVFTGLLDKIIDMPSMPLFSRSVEIAGYEAVCRSVVWREERIKSGDGVEVALAVGRVEAGTEGSSGAALEGRENVVVVYFQGHVPTGVCTAIANAVSSNGSSLPPRLPSLSLVLEGLYACSPTNDAPTYTIVALSYRGFWTSSGRPSESGTALDAAAAVNWVSQIYLPDSKLVLWGQSLGAGVAANAVDAHIQNRPNRKSQSASTLKEEPEALKVNAKSNAKPTVLILPAGHDELVPEPHAAELEEVCKDGEMTVQRVVVKVALHHEVLSKPKGRQAVVVFLRA